MTQIKDFGLWYLINRLRQSGKFSKKTGTETSRYLVGAASEITTILLDILTACVDGKITSLRPVSDPAPSPKGDPLSEVENILGAKEKVENIVDATKKWLKNR